MNKRTGEQAELTTREGEVMVVPDYTRLLSLSANYQNSNSDIELRSKDGVKFLVHKANLSSGSKVFADMFEVGSNYDSKERPVLELEESSLELEKILPYFYPNRVDPWVIKLPADLKVFAVLDKYEIWRAIEAVETEMRRVVDGGYVQVQVAAWLDLYLFYNHFDVLNAATYKRRALTYLLTRITDGTTPVQPTLEQLRFIKVPQCFNISSDITKIISWCQNRFWDAHNIHQKLGLKLISDFPKHHHYPDNIFPNWVGIGKCVTSIGTNSHRVQFNSNDQGVCPKCDSHLRKLITEYKAQIHELETSDFGP